MNIKLINRLKLARMIMKFGEIKTDNGTLIFEGDVVEGLDVFVEKEGELVPALDGEYKTEDGKTIVVVSGKIETIVDPEAENEPVEEQPQIENEEVENPTNEGEETDTEAIVEIRKEVNELYARIEELERIIKDKDTEIERLNSHIEQFSKPATLEVDTVEINNKSNNKALKYFKTK